MLRPMSVSILLIVCVSLPGCIDDGSECSNGSEQCDSQDGDALVIGNNGNNGTDSDANGNTNSDATNGSTDASNMNSGPTPMCPYPEETASASLAEGAPNAAKEIDLTFYPSGALKTVDGRGDCKPTDNPYPGSEPGTTTDCFDTYECDGCVFYLGRRLLQNGMSGWYLVDVTVGESEMSSCPKFEGFYPWEIQCQPDCAGKQCGPDGCGGTCGSTCTGNEVCSQDTYTCECPDGCLQNGVCCGGAFCADDCVGTPCCT